MKKAAPQRMSGEVFTEDAVFRAVIHTATGSWISGVEGNE